MRGDGVRGAGKGRVMRWTVVDVVSGWWVGNGVGDRHFDAECYLPSLPISAFSGE